MNKSVKFALMKLGYYLTVSTEQEFNLIEKMRFYSQKHQRLCIARCNGEDGLTEVNYNKALKQIEDKIVSLINEFNGLSGLKMLELVEFQDDPRGWTVKTSCYPLNIYLNYYGGYV